MPESSDNEKNNIDFSWGKKKGRGPKGKDIHFYDSFRYDGVEYRLYDCVYLYKDGEGEPPYVGKLLKIWEAGKKQKRIKVLWFFHPSEISNHLEGVDVDENELFLASGKGVGLCNINPLEAIAGNCNVVCISKDERNRQPLDEELKMAHYVFYRTFNVDSLEISEKLDEKIAEVEVKLLLNKNDVELAELAKLDNGIVVADVQKQLVSAKEVPVTGKLILKDGEGAKDELEQSKCLPVQGNDTVGPDAHVRYTLGVNGDVMRDAGLDSLLVEDDKDSKQNGDTAKACKSGNVDSPAANEGLNSGQKTNTKALGTKKVIKSDFDVTSPDNKRSKTVSQVKRAVSGVGKDVSESRPTKMLKLNDTFQKSIGVDGAGTPKAAHALHTSNESVQPTVLKAVRAHLGSNETAQPSGCAADGSNGAKLGSINDCLPRKQLSDKVIEENLDVKVHKTSMKHFQDEENSADTISKRPASAAERNGGKPSKGLNVTGDNLSYKKKSIVSVENKPYEKKGKVQQSKDHVFEAYGNVKEVTTRPPDRSKWFTASPWEDRLKEAHDQEKLVFLQNLDPSYNSSDVENIIWHGLGESCTARVLQCTATSSRHSGEAFAIFRTRDIAQRVLMKLDQDCLMLPNGRPLVGCVRAVEFPVKQPRYFGHLVLDKIKQQMQKESRDAVSTSHSSQSNTLEYEMALEWRLLQERADLWWKRLYKKQGEEMKKLKASQKSK